MCGRTADGDEWNKAWWRFDCLAQSWHAVNTTQDWSDLSQCNPHPERQVHAFWSSPGCSETWVRERCIYHQEVSRRRSPTVCQPATVHKHHRRRGCVYSWHWATISVCLLLPPQIFITVVYIHQKANSDDTVCDVTQVTRKRVAFVDIETHFNNNDS